MSVSSNIDSGSRLILRIAEPSGKRSHHKEPITESCWVRTTQIGGGSLKFRCQTASDSSRPSKPIMASALEIAYRIEIPLFDENGNLIRKTLASSSDGTTKILFTKAQSILHLGDKNICKYVNFFARWSNPTHPQLSGPWTGPFFEVIG